MKTFFISLMLSLALTATTAFAGTMEGKVTLVENGQAVAVKDQLISLRIFSRSKQAEIASSEERTDAQGHYLFQGLQTEPEYIYLVKAEFEGASYTEGPLQFPKGTTKMQIRPLELTHAHSDLALLDISESMSLSFGKNDLIKISHAIMLRNTSPLLYSPQKSGGQPLNFSLPAGAFDFQFETEAAQDFFRAEQIKGLTLEQPLPGNATEPTRVAYSYLIAYKNTSLSIPVTSNAPLRTLEVSLVDGPKVRFSSSDLAKKDGAPQTFQGGPFPAQKEVMLKFYHLPLKNALFRQILFSGLLITLLLLGVFWWMPSQKLAPDQTYANIIDRLRKLQQDRTQGLISEETFTSEESYLRNMAYLSLNKQTDQKHDS